MESHFYFNMWLCIYIYNRWKSSPTVKWKISVTIPWTLDADYTSFCPHWLLFPLPPPRKLRSADFHLALGPRAFPGISPTAENPGPLQFWLPGLCSYLKHNQIALSCFAHRFCCAAQYTSEEKFLALKTSIYKRLHSSLHGQLCNWSFFSPVIHSWDSIPQN